MSVTKQDAIRHINQALERLDAGMEAAECQGLLAGWICAARTLERTVWLGHLVQHDIAGDVLAKEACDALDGLRQGMVEHMNDPVLDFQLLLPDDEQPLMDRTLALGEWCHGFLYGLTLGGIAQPEHLPEEAGEVVRDMAQLARAGSYDIEDGEEDEQAYAELVEYVRTAVLLLNEELNPTQAPPRSDNTLH